MAAKAAILDFRSERFYLFLINLSPWCWLPSFKSIGLLVQKKRKIDFQDGGQGGHLGFPIRTILAIFDLQVTLMLPTKFQISWPFISEEEVKNSFARWPPWWPSWISYQNNISFFVLQVTLMLPISSFKPTEKQIFKMATTAAILDFRLEPF